MDATAGVRSGFLTERISDRHHGSAAEYSSSNIAMSRLLTIQDLIKGFHKTLPTELHFLGTHDLVVKAIRREKS